jgi:hypothetical protein
VRPPGIPPELGAGQATDCWFDQPLADDRRSWTVPSGHGTYQGLSLELLNPADEDERMLLIEALHPELEDALRRDEEMVIDGEALNPRLHITLHQVVASQLLADDPPETWPTVRRLAGLGYDWHNVMHMIAAVITDDIYKAMKEHLPFDPGDHARRLNDLPGDWPPPQALEPQ